MDAKRHRTVHFAAGRLAQVCDGELLQGDPKTGAAGVSTDTRSLAPGQAFVALVGPNHDAHAYLSDAVAAGASVLMVHRLPEPLDPPEHVAVVRVADTERALLSLAAWHRGQLDATVVAVTGSCGKSTVKDMLGAILGRTAATTTAPASFNNRIGVAHTLLAAGADDRYVVLEMGTNHPGEIAELAGAARPEIGVITHIGKAHLEGLGGPEGVREAKAELIPHLPRGGALILNADSPECLSLRVRYAGRVLTFATRGTADVRPRDLERTDDGWRFEALARRFHLPCPARYDVDNAAAALCAARALEISPDVAAAALADFQPRGLRYQRMELDGVLFVLDCYNSNPTALRAALKSFVMERNPGRKVVVCGDMLELGDAAPLLHRRAGEELARSDIDALFAVGKLGRCLLNGWNEVRPAGGASHFECAREAWQPLWESIEPGDAVLLKGSRGTQLETIAERIAEHLGLPGREVA